MSLPNECKIKKRVGIGWCNSWLAKEGALPTVQHNCANCAKTRTIDNKDTELKK